MKKSLFFVAAAAVVLASCSSDVKISENTVPVGSNQQREIAFSSVAHTLKHAPVINGVFPTTSTMQVTAFDADSARDFFGATEFSYSGANAIWKGGKYWPLSPATINFLAYAELEGTATWNATHPASAVSLAMDDNSSAQKDLMYACGTGTVTQNSNALEFPTNVPMAFKHAQAWVSFMADAYDATSGDKVTLDSIVLNGAKYSGTYAVTHHNYDKTKAQREADATKNGSVDGLWSNLGGAQNVKVPNWTPAAIAYDGSGDGVAVGDGLLIVPDEAATPDFTSFTIHYKLDGKAYSYTYTPASTNVAQANHYVYNIVFHLHEIEIHATVTPWADGGSTNVPVF